MWLARIDRKAAELEQRQAEEEHRRPIPDWILELNRATGHPLAVHVGDCGMAGRRRRQVDRDGARRLLTVDGEPACPICRPDTALHITEHHRLASTSFVPLVRRSAQPSSPPLRGAQLAPYRHRVRGPLSRVTEESRVGQPSRAHDGS